MAQDSGFGVSLGYGQAEENIEIYKMGLIKTWNVEWLKSRLGYINGYFELSYNRWEGGDDQIDGGAFSPVFQYLFNTGIKGCIPYYRRGARCSVYKRLLY